MCELSLWVPTTQSSMQTAPLRIPLWLQVMLQPVVTPCGRTFEYEALRHWITQHGRGEGRAQLTVLFVVGWACLHTHTHTAAVVTLAATASDHGALWGADVQILQLPAAYIQRRGRSSCQCASVV